MATRKKSNIERTDQTPEEAEAERRQHVAARALRMVTASKLDLAMECLHWTTAELPPDRTGDAAKYGKAFHSLAESGAHEEQLDEHEEFLAQERFRGWLEKGQRLLPRGYREEVAYCLHTDGKVTKIGSKLGRDYGVYVGICGTLDIDSPSESVDYKTGKRLKPAQLSWQLRFASVVTGSDRRSFHYIAGDGSVTADSYVTNPVEREDDKARLVLLMNDIITGRTAAKPGAHCTALYCPARKACEAHQDHQKAQETQMGRMGLNHVTKGKLEAPLSVLVYGTEGIGKSTFAAGAPDPIYLDPDNGTGLLDVARFPKPETWAECMEALDVLAAEKHEHKTFVTDTADALEALIHREVCRLGNKKGMEDFGFGKGYVAALDLGREYLVKLEALRTKGMHIVTLAHAHVKNFQNPAGDDYDRYRLKLHDKLGALLKEWHAAVLFANYRAYTVEKDGKVKALGDGSRVLYTEHRPAWDAKNRYGLPYELPLDWAEFERCARAGEPAAIDAVLVELNALIDGAADDALKTQTTVSRDRCGKDVRKLALLVNWLKGKLAASAPATSGTVAA
jgi:hypothetical protein